MSRPLLNKTTQELAHLFADCGDARDALQQIADELTHRRVPSARALRKKVEATLAGVAGGQPQTNAGIDSSADIPSSNDGEPPSDASTENGQSEKRKRAADYASPPTEFTTIQPLGVSNRPSAFRPVLKNDVRLEIGKDDAPAKVFRVALFALIREMKTRRIGTRQFTLENGERVKGDSGGFSYQFEFTEEANLFENAKVDLVIGGRPASGNITALSAGRLIVTLQDDFGPVIRMCVLRIDNTALLQALHDRFQKIEAGEVPAFRAEFAANILRNAGQPNSALPIPRWPTGNPPNERQRNRPGIGQ